MMGSRQVEQPELFYEFSLDRHVPPDHLLGSIDGLSNLMVFAQNSHRSTGR